MYVIALRKILRNYHVNFIGQLPSKLPYFGHSFEPEAVTIAKLPSNAGVLGSTHCADENHRVSLHTQNKKVINLKLDVMCIQSLHNSWKKASYNQGQF